MHRDINLHNILYSSSENCFKICDFGSAVQLAAPDSRERKKVGTLGYCAPEIVAAAYYGLAVDIYSLGALLMMILTS